MLSPTPLRRPGPGHPGPPLILNLPAAAASSISTAPIDLSSGPSESGKERPRLPRRRPKPGERGRVLVMDDEQSILTLLSAALNRLGFLPTITRDGQAALDAAEEALGEPAPFRLAILDLTIPGGMGGVETAEGLGRLQPDLVLIASSGYAQNPALTDFSNYGFHAALVKPYRIPDLSKLLDRLLDED